MVVSLASIRNQLLPGLLQIQGEYKPIPPEWEGIFANKKARYSQETALSVRYLGPASQKTEMGSITYDNNAGDRWKWTMEPIEAATGYVMSRKAIDDGLYKANFRPANLGLLAAMRAFWQAQAANIFNTATTYDSALGGDGVALLSTSHPYDGGTWANTHSTPLALNEASLIANAKLIRQEFRDEAGILQDVFPETLLVPVHLEDVAIRLTKTELRPGTANNDVNVIPMLAGGVKGYRVMRYFTSNYRWFLTTTVKGLIHLTKTPFETDMDIDFDTKSMKVSAYERAGFFYCDPRCVVGENATS
jgi:hypothetical protein